jgi:hypothetical protein
MMTRSTMLCSLLVVCVMRVTLQVGGVTYELFDSYVTLSKFNVLFVEPRECLFPGTMQWDFLDTELL